MPDGEAQRLADDAARRANWKRWGPYLAERQWGTVREDYSENGDCWGYFSHDQARRRAYRWGEDGLLGISDRQCRLCFALALWNGKDPILKERLFGLTNPEGNHGEDVKEHYFYLDSSPTHSYMKALYKYPQEEFPYARLVEEGRRRGPHDPEFEISDTGIFDEDKYFDVFIEYAKMTPEDILIAITIANRGPDAASIDVLPTLWFRNTWAWGRAGGGHSTRPSLQAEGDDVIVADHSELGAYRFESGPAPDGGKPRLIFTENETNIAALFGGVNSSPHVKDAFHDLIVNGRQEAVNPTRSGTKAAAHYHLTIPAHGEIVLRLRLTSAADQRRAARDAAAGFDRCVALRRQETDAFYADCIGTELKAEQQRIARQAYAGLLWSKQFYHYVVEEWQQGDPAQPSPPEPRTRARNAEWGHLYNRDVISMPDKWEYPWYAAWDLAFHMIPFSRIDPDFAKEQLLLLLREWYMHPNGQIPAYEFAFGDVNPPVHAWACWRVYTLSGRRDRVFLARCFQKLLLNFTWWVNRKDVEGKHVFSGGFLGLDNIGVFDRSRPLPTGGHLEQADGTAWMAFYCVTMLAMSLELAKDDPAYEDVASKFFEHFVSIADAINTLGGTGLWNEEDGFYYDQLHLDHTHIPLKVRSLVGLIPLLAVETLEEDLLRQLPGFAKRMRWFLENRRDLARHISFMRASDDAQHDHAHYLLAIPSKDRLERTMRYLLDESEFLSPFGLRSVSRCHEKAPYAFHADGQEFRVAYEPGESKSGLFGGNSNWRGPIWFPVNFLLLEALEKYDHFYGQDFKVECPTGSGRYLTLRQATAEIRRRLCSIFTPDRRGRRPCHGDDPRFARNPHWRDLLLYHEYFHADTGRGLGASHQTGWTALVAPCLQDLASAQEAPSSRPPATPRISSNGHTTRNRAWKEALS
jgi:hypothetical protein